MSKVCVSGDRLGKNLKKFAKFSLSQYYSRKIRMKTDPYDLELKIYSICRFLSGEVHPVDSGSGGDNHP